MTAPSMADEPRHVQINADGGMARITVDGTNISKSVQSYALEHRHGQDPLLVLYVAPHRGLDFEGLAHIAVAEPERDEGQIIAGFLASITPAALERAALDRDDLDGSRHEITAAMLAQLADWAQGNG